MQNSELILRDEEGHSVVNELKEFSSDSEHAIGPAAISIENSSDVIIGPVTQFHGPVTIYQNVNVPNNNPKKNNHGTSRVQNGKLVKDESFSTDNVHGPDKPNKNLLRVSKRIKYIGIPVILLILIIVVIICITTLLNNPENKYRPNPIDEEKPTLEPLGTFVDRNTWGGYAPLNFTKPLRHPTPFVIISHTVTPFCQNFTDCSYQVASIQAHHVTIGSPDIGYNFIIGGDARIYVGRGWDIANFHSNNSIGICFIGNYVYDSLTTAMIKSAHDLIDEGVKTGKLSRDYKLIAHNQTYATESPGKNVYAVIKTWPHFDPNKYVLRILR